MITDSYSKMVSDVSMRSMMQNTDFAEDLGMLIREQRRQDVASDREKELSMYRSGSAPPTVEGALSAVGGLLDAAALSGFQKSGGGRGFASEEELRADPMYVDYYYSNVNMNPRLPPPLLSKEDWRFAQRQRLHGGAVVGGIGDRRKVNRNGGVEEKRAEAEWGGDGLIGLPSLGLGRQKSIAEIIQDDISQHSSRPASRNAFNDNVESSIGALASHSYASALSSSLSRSTTPDPQLIARAPSPRIPPIGGGRSSSMNKSINGPNSFNGISSDLSESSELATAFSGLNLSTNSMVAEENNSRSQIQHEIDERHNLFNLKQNPYINNSSTTVHGGSSSSHYLGIDNMHSSVPSYGFSGYANNSISSPVMGQLGSGNLMPAALELQNISRGRNPLALMDPMYHQYLRSQEYAAAQFGALNNPTMDRENMNNSYMDLLQKAYLGQMFSPQKSQYGTPYPGKYDHGYYGSPVRHGEQNMRFACGTRNLAGSAMGAWHSEHGGNLDESFTSSLLDEFKSNKARCFELSEIAGHVVEFSADQYGSRFIQQKLETASPEEKNMVFHEIKPQAQSLMTDVFGNYVIQKFFEHGSASQIRELADQLTGHVLTLSLQMYGCRVIQKAIEVVDLDQKTKMVTELDGHIMRCVRDQNGNHVIQKCIECVPEDSIQFIVSTFYDQVVTLSTHPYGCRVIQRVLEHCHDPKTQHIVMSAVLESVCMLAQDQYGNYVVQHVLEHGKPEERTSIIKKLTGQIVQMSQQKFASNVVEKCLSFGTLTERQVLVTEMLGTTDENEPLQAMMKDQYANYVVQKVLETCDERQLELILNRIKVHLNALKKYTYGKHIVARVEKLVAAGERRISSQSFAAHAYAHPVA